MEQFGIIDLVLVCCLSILLIMSIINLLKISRSSCVFVGYSSLMYLVFGYSLCRGLHFFLIFGLEYSVPIIGLAPFFHYAELYMYIIDDLSNILLFFMFLQFCSISIHSLNVHPAIVVLQEKIDMHVLFIIFVVIVSLYAFLSLFCYSYSFITVSILSLINTFVFSSLEIFLIFEILRYGKKVAGLFQQALLSNELKHKQLSHVIGKLSIPGFALLFRVVFRIVMLFTPFVQLKSQLWISCYVIITEIVPIVCITLHFYVVIDQSQLHHEFFEQISTSLQTIINV